MGHQDFGVMRCVRVRVLSRWPYRPFVQFSWTRRATYVEFWKADFGNDTRMEGGTSVIPYQWRRPEEMAERSEWRRPHFKSLGHFGVWARGGHGSIFPSRRGPILQSARYITSLQTATDMSTLTAVIQAGVITDGFLSGVLESVKDSDNNFFRLMETASWRDIVVLIRRMQRFPMHITGPICSPTWHISYVLVRCALHRKVQINCVWGRNLSHPSHFNLSPVGLWI